MHKLGHTVAQKILRNPSVSVSFGGYDLKTGDKLSCIPGCCLGGVVGCFTEHRQEMNPGIKLESATSGVNYSSRLFLAGDK